jgi:hypothetical protein
MATDLESYSSTGPARHEHLQTVLFTALDAALAAALGPDVARCDRQPQGDGELTVLPPGLNDRRMLRLLLVELTRELAGANAKVRPEWAARLRIGLDSGQVGLGPGGFTGDSPVTAGRLCNAQIVKDALSASHGDYVVVASDHLYRDVIAPAFDADPAWAFERVEVTDAGKGFHAVGWLHVPARGPAPPGASGPPRGRDDGPPQVREGGLIG